MKKSTKITIFVLLGIAIAAALGFYIWSQQTYKATDELHQLVTKNDYTEQDGWYEFEPKENAKLGIILYPGAKVEPIAYGYLAKQLSLEGYYVAIPKMTLNMAIFDTNIAQEMMDKNPKITQWVIGGHSLGGVTAAEFAANHPEKIVGLLLLASYPSDNVDFSNGTLQTLSIYGDHDRVTTPKDVLANQELLSTTAILHELQGGNHSGFGMYGEQADDGKATITNLEQQNRIVNQTAKWLKRFD
ncbi:MAG TPA: alpha/beta hydrolase [Kurthia sp.]